MASQENKPGSPELSVVSTDEEIQSLPTPAPFLVLEIRRGKTGFPERPVWTRNFVMGSGPGCDLRLGSPHIPDAHSVLFIGENDVRIQWLAEAPALLINGEEQDEAILTDGDQIGIGPFEFTVQRLLIPANVQPGQLRIAETTPTAQPMETSDLMGLLSQAKDLEQEADYGGLSASELAGQLEAEQEQLEHFEQTQKQGEQALLYAAAQRAADLEEEPQLAEETPQAEDVKPADEVEVLEELERVIQQLSGFSSELEERAKRLADQEATQAEAADLLLEAQQELAAQLERFHQQVTEQSVESKPKLHKAA